MEAGWDGVVEREGWVGGSYNTHTRKQWTMHIAVHVVREGCEEWLNENGS